MNEWGEALRGEKLAGESWSARRDVPLLIGYGLAFHVLHSLAAWWGGPGFYSLWFPAAGLRFALLWMFGARLTLWVVAVELVVQLLAGVLVIGRPGWVEMAISIARPVLAYGLAVMLVRRLARHPRSPLSTPPMPVGFAAVLAPVGAALAALPWSVWRPQLTGVENMRDIVSSLSSFATGDLLGVLLLSPPLIVLAHWWAGSKRERLRVPTPPELLEGGLALAAALLLVWALATLKIGYSGMPLLLAACWIGLRFGVVAAWATNVAVAGLVFPLTTRLADPGSRLDLHMAVAAVAIAGYLAASLSDATARSRAEIARRDRLLLQAERLKTLRAMSVAVIHEVSQPLSTLVLETRHLRQLADRSGERELSDTARLVERKTDALAAMTRRLRDFGGRGTGPAAPVALGRCLGDAVALLAHEAPAQRVRVEGGGRAGALVSADRLELTQALVNLLRNAASADGGEGEIIVSLVSEGRQAQLTVRNAVRQSALPGGMGVGSMIARAIVEAAGGTLTHEQTDGWWHARLTLPTEEER